MNDNQSSGRTQPMTRAEARKILLRRRGELAKISRELGLSPVIVSQVSRGKGQSRRVMEALLARAAQISMIEQEAARQESAREHIENIRKGSAA